MSKSNPKFRLLNPQDPPPAQRTYIVIGLGRSGTSFVASVLRFLGVFMGDETTERTLEDQRLARAIEKRGPPDAAAISDVINDYNGRFDVWGYKRPSMLIRAARTESMFRNPRYIVTHRDFFALALRNEISISREITDGLKKSVASSTHLYDFIESSTAPSLNISFELMDANPLRAAEVIRDFVHPQAKGMPIAATEFHAFMDERLKKYLG